MLVLSFSQRHLVPLGSQGEAAEQAAASSAAAAAADDQMADASPAASPLHNSSSSRHWEQQGDDARASMISAGAGSESARPSEMVVGTLDVSARGSMVPSRGRLMSLPPPPPPDEPEDDVVAAAAAAAPAEADSAGAGAGVAVAAAGGAAVLPPGWKQRVDAEGQVYYTNKSLVRVCPPARSGLVLVSAVLIGC